MPPSLYTIIIPHIRIFVKDICLPLFIVGALLRTFAQYAKKVYKRRDTAACGVRLLAAYRLRTACAAPLFRICGGFRRICRIFGSRRGHPAVTASAPLAPRNAAFTAEIRSHMLLVRYAWQCGQSNVRFFNKSVKARKANRFLRVAQKRSPAGGILPALRAGYSQLVSAGLRHLSGNRRGSMGR